MTTDLDLVPGVGSLESAMTILEAYAVGSKSGSRKAEKVGWDLICLRKAWACWTRRGDKGPAEAAESERLMLRPSPEEDVDS